MDFEHVLPLVPVVAVGVVFVCIPRLLFLGVMEVIMVAFGIFMGAAPKCFLETFLGQNASKFGETDHLFFTVLGAQLLVLASISFLTRRHTNDESTLKTLMGYWLRVQMVFAAEALRNLTNDATHTRKAAKGEGKTAETLTTFDINRIPKSALAAYSYDVVLLIAMIVIVVRWPSFKMKTRMSTENQVNRYLLFDRVYTGFIMLIYVIMPEIFVQNSFVTFPLSGETLPLMRLIGLVGLCYCGHVRAVESYYSDADKLPLIIASLAVAPVMFGALLVPVLSAGMYTFQHWLGGLVFNVPVIAVKILAYFEAKKKEHKGC